MLAIPAGAGCGLNLVALGPISRGWERGCGPVDVRLDDACPWPNGPRPWPGIFTASPADVTSRSSCPGGLPEAKNPGQQSSFWPSTSCLTIMIKPAAEGGGQPIRGRGVASERRMAGTGPALGGVRGEALPSEALQAPLGRTASLGPTAFFSVREVGGRGGRGRRVLGVLGVGPGSLRGVGRGGCSEPVGKCVCSH